MKYIDKTKKAVRVFLVFVCLSFISVNLTYPKTVYGSGGEFFASNPNMRIGLIYSGGTVQSFQTSSETGFLFGYVENNASDKFNVLCYVSNKKIEVSRSASDNAAVITDADTGGQLYKYLDGDNNFAVVAATESNKNLTKGQTITELSAKNTGLTTTPSNNLNFGAFIYRITDSGVEVINLISLEDYIKGVLPYEIYASWSDEALTAFSIAARSFSVFSARRHANDGFMLCNTTHCQFYAGSRRATDRTNAAIDATKDLVMTYNSQVIEAVYHASSGGVTENHNDAWGGEMRFPYLSSVTVPYEKYDTPGRANSMWTNTASPQDLYEYLVGGSPQSSKFKGILNSAISNIIINERSPSSNYIKSVTVVDRNNNKVTVTNSANIRSMFGKYANSANMDIYKASKFRSYVLQGGNGKTGASFDIESGQTHILTANGIVKSTPNDSVLHVLTANGKYMINAYATGGDFIFDGKGWGHGVGLSQWGMFDMAEAGYQYDEILKTFYTGVSIEKITNVRK